LLTSPPFGKTLLTGNDVLRPMLWEAVVDLAEHFVRPDDSTIDPDLDIAADAWN
jgi:hypothetical protein